MANPTVLKMVKASLKAGGFDGLFNENGECACVTDDLAPCGQICEECEAGYKIEYPDRECSGGICDGGCDFHIHRDKRDCAEGSS